MIRPTGYYIRRGAIGCYSREYELEIIHSIAARRYGRVVDIQYGTGWYQRECATVKESGHEFSREGGVEMGVDGICGVGGGRKSSIGILSDG